MEVNVGNCSDGRAERALLGVGLRISSAEEPSTLSALRLRLELGLELDGIVLVELPLAVEATVALSASLTGTPSCSLTGGFFSCLAAAMFSFLRTRRLVLASKSHPSGAVISTHE